VLERLNPFLRVLCFTLAALVVYQTSRLALSKTRAVGVLSTNLNLGATAKGATNDTRLSPEATAQVEKIKESQILGMIMRPPPMALIGIAGRDVILRTPNGQTGLLREGEQLAGVKLLKIGTNRILIEHEGQQKELTLFQGFGSETLLPRKESSAGKDVTK
jgi:hypothetical protein